MKYLSKFMSVFFMLGVLLCSTGYAAQVKAVATFSILGDVVKNVGGDKIDLTVLVGADGDAHTFEPTPKEGIVLSKAAIIFENGLYFEHWMNDLYASSGSKAKRVVATAGIEPISFSTHERVDVNGNPEDVDPHAWQSVYNVMVMTKNVQDGLIAVDPANASFYKKNADEYLSRLSELNQWILTIVNTIPTDKRKLVTSHDALGYFAKAYGFKVIGAAIPSATTEAEDPSAAETAKLLETIKSSGVKALFSENIQNAKLIKALSVDAGVVMAPELYTDALGSEGSEGDTYINMMKHNVNIFAEYLK